MFELPEAMSRERFDNYITIAARQANYEDGFGVKGCDLTRSDLYANYNRQSLKEQADNDRLGEYMLTSALKAKEMGATIPYELILYDCDSSEDLDRPSMSYLRNDLIANRLIAGIIIPQQGRLSDKPLHQLIFDQECQHYGVKVIYGDAPSGNDWSSETARLVQAKANELRVLNNQQNALAGSKSRVLAGKVPAHKPPYGYRLQRETSTESHTGRIRILNAWWVPDEIGPGGEPIPLSPVWVVSKIFEWAGSEERTAYWIANRLNELKISAPGKLEWAPKAVIQIIRRQCYTGKAEFNSTGRVPNPERPLGDLTHGVKKTIIRPKSQEERIPFEVPPLTDECLWQRANDTLTKRGRGRGKQGRSIEALLRNRVLCPKCNKTMSVKRDKRGRIYYYCRSHYSKWLQDRCDYNHFVPGTWDDQIWDDICAWLSNDAWIHYQINHLPAKAEGIEKRIRLQQWKINQAEDAIRKIHDGWEKDLYASDEAEQRLSKHRCIIDTAKAEIERLQTISDQEALRPSDVQSMAAALKELRDNNLRDASFQERQDIVAKLGIKITPTEDLSTRTIQCRLNLYGLIRKNNADDSAIVLSGTPGGIRTHDLSLRRAALYPAELQAPILKILLQ